MIPRGAMTEETRKRAEQAARDEYEAARAELRKAQLRAEDAWALLLRFIEPDEKEEAK